MVEQVGAFVALGVGAAAGRHAEAGAQLVGLITGTLGDEVDDAAAGAHALNGAGAVDDLDALDHRRIDDVTLTRAVAQRGRLGHAVDHDQRLAAAQGFAIAGHLLAAGAEAGQQVTEDLRQVVGDRQLLAQGLTIDHRHRGRHCAHRLLAAGGGYHHGFHRLISGGKGGVDGRQHGSSDRQQVQLGHNNL